MELKYSIERGSPYPSVSAHTKTIWCNREKKHKEEEKKGSKTDRRKQKEEEKGEGGAFRLAQSERLGGCLRALAASNCFHIGLVHGHTHSLTHGDREPCNSVHTGTKPNAN